MGNVPPVLVGETKRAFLPIDHVPPIGGRTRYNARVLRAGSWIALLLAGCPFLEPGFEDVHHPPPSQSPCYSANLANGLSSTDPEELRSVFRCLNTGGGFDPWAPTVDSMVEGRTRIGTHPSQELGTLVTGVMDTTDLVGFLRESSELLAQRDAFLLHVVHTVAEWGFGRPWPEVEAAFALGGQQFLAPEASAEGLLLPIVPVLRTVAGLLLDDSRVYDVAASLSDLLQRPELADAAHTLAVLVDGPEGELFRQVPTAFAAWCEADAGPDGRSTIFQVVTALLAPNPSWGGRSTLVELQGPLGTILGDTPVTDQVIDEVGHQHDDGRLSALPGALHGLAVIDQEGGPVLTGEESALESVLVLFEAADRPVQCGFLQTSSLSRYLLETFASWDPDTLGEAIVLTEGLVDALVGLGELACSGLESDVRNRLPSLIRLAESGAFASLVPLLDALHDPDSGDTERFVDLVDGISLVVRGGVVPSMVAHGRAELDQPFLGQTFQILGAFVTPGSAEARADLRDLLGLVRALIQPPAFSGLDDSPLALLIRPLPGALEAHEGLIQAWFLRWAVLLRTPGAESHGFMHEFAPLVAVDPELRTLSELGRLVGRADVFLPALRILETAVVASALAAASSTPDREGPLGELARFAADGSLADLLDLLVWLADTLDHVGLVAPGPDGT